MGNNVLADLGFAMRTLESAWPLPGGYGHARELHQFVLDRPGGRESAKVMSNGTRTSDQTVGRRSMSADFQPLLQKSSSPCSLMNFRSISWMGYILWPIPGFDRRVGLARPETWVAAHSQFVAQPTPTAAGPVQDEAGGYEPEVAALPTGTGLGVEIHAGADIGTAPAPAPLCVSSVEGRAAYCNRVLP